MVGCVPQFRYTSQMGVSFQIGSALAQLAPEGRPHNHKYKRQYQPMTAIQLRGQLDYRFSSLISHAVKTFEYHGYLFAARFCCHIKQYCIICCNLWLQITYLRLLYMPTPNCLRASYRPFQCLVWSELLESLAYHNLSSKSRYIPLKASGHKKKLY